MCTQKKSRSGTRPSRVVRGLSTPLAAAPPPLPLRLLLVSNGITPDCTPSLEPPPPGSSSEDGDGLRNEMWPTA